MGDNYRRSVKIFIGGLSFETSDEALKRYFERFGPVADAIVMKDAVSRRSRGFGFITYVNAASVDAALSVEQHIVDNRRVEAKRAVPRSEVPSKMEGPLAQSPSIQPQGSWDAPFGMENYVLRGVGGEGRTRSNSTVSASSIGGMMAMDGAPMANKIFVGGLHYETRDASLHAYFEQFGPVQTAEVMFNRETHKSRGFGFVVFESEESANAVLQSTHHTVNGKVVEVKRAVPRAQSSTAGSNPNSPAMMGYHPSSPSALGGVGMLGKSAAAGPKRPQRPRPSRESMVAPSNGAVPASPQQRFQPTTSYAAVLRFGAGRQHHSSVSPHGGGKPPQHHAHMQGRDEIGGFRLPHSTHGGYSIPPGAAARAEAAAAQAFVRELQAWDVENSGQGLKFDEPFDYYSDQQRASTLRDYAKHADMEGMGGAGSGDTSFSTGLHGHTSWPSEARSTWTQPSQSGNIGRQQQHQQQPRLQQAQQQRPPADVMGLLARNRPEEDVSPRRPRQHSAFFSRGSDPSTSVLYRSSSAQNGEGYLSTNHGHPSKTFSEAPNGRLLSPGEGGGTPALMSSSPLLRDGGLLETAFADLKLDGATHAVATNSSVIDGPAPNGDGPSLLSEIGGGGPPSAASKAVPYGRAGGETAVDGGGGTDGLASCGVWSADAFGSALGVNVLSTANDIMGSGGHGGISERRDITGGELSDHFSIGALEPPAADGATAQLRWH